MRKFVQILVHSATASTADHQYRNGASANAAAAAIHSRQTRSNAKNIGSQINDLNHFHSNGRRRRSSSPRLNSDDEEEGQYERIPSAIPRPKPPNARTEKPPVTTRSNTRQQPGKNVISYYHLMQFSNSKTSAGLIREIF